MTVIDPLTGSLVSSADNTGIQIGGAGEDAGTGTLIIDGSGSDIVLNDATTFVTAGNFGDATLTVSNGATLRLYGQAGLVQEHSLRAGNRAGGTGDILIDNATVLLGTDGTNPAGADVQSTLRLGVAAGATGTLTVIGAAAELLMQGKSILNVGTDGGSGVLRVGDNARIETIKYQQAGDDFSGMFIGRQAGSTGSMVIDSGGQVAMSDVSKLGIVGLRVGGSSGSGNTGTGSMTISGTQSQLLLQAPGTSLGIGTNGNGNFVLENGGRVLLFADASGQIASNSSEAYAQFVVGRHDGTGTATITDADLIIGAAGIDTQGTADFSDDTFTLLADGQATLYAALEVGREAGSTGTLTVSGGEADIALYGFNSEIYVGRAGTGSLTIAGGAQIVSSAQFIDGQSFVTSIGDQAGSVGTLTITGFDSLLETAGTVFVGTGNSNDGLGAGGQANVTVADYGTLRAGQHIQIGGDTADTSFTRTLTLDNGRLDTPLLVVGEGGLLTGSGGISGDLLVEGAMVVGSPTGGAITVGDLLGTVTNDLRYTLRVGAGEAGQGQAIIDNGTVLIGSNGVDPVDAATNSRIRLAVGDSSDPITTGAQGSLILRGADTLVDMYGRAGLILGESLGTGSLTIEGGTLRVGQVGTTTNPFIDLGNDQGSTGVLRVTGTDSLLHANGRFSLNIGGTGLGGTGSLIVDAGGKIAMGDASHETHNFMVLGDGTDGAISTGTLDLTGAGSSISVAGTLDVRVGRNGGSGTMTVRDGASLTVQQTVSTGVNDDESERTTRLFVGDNPGSIGSLEITSGSTVRLENRQTSGRIGVIVGYSDSGSISDPNRSVGAMSISGTNALLHIKGPDSFMNLGNGGNGSLSISDGASLAIEATPSVGEPSYAGMGIGFRNGFGIANFSNALVAIGDQAGTDFLRDPTSTTQTTTDIAYITVGRQEGGFGNLVITDNSRVNIGGISTIISIGHLGSGSMIIADGGQLHADLAIPGAQDYLITVGELPGMSGELLVTGNDSLLAGGGSMFVGAGSDGLGAGGQANVKVADSGTLRANQLIQIGGDNADTSFTRTLTLDNGTLDTPSVIIGRGGLLAGTGSLTGSLLVKGGRVAAGASPGTLQISGDLRLTDQGRLEVEIAGAQPGQFDVYEVAGLADLSGGTVSLSFLGGYTPVANDSFTFLTADAGIVLGDNANQILLSPDGQGLAYTVAADETTGTASIVFTSVGRSTEEIQADVVTETTQSVATSAVRTVVGAIGSRIRAYRLAPSGQVGPSQLALAGTPNMTGIAGGDAADGLNFWADGTTSRLDSDITNSPFKGYTQSLLLGVDKLLPNVPLVIGAAASVDNTNLDLQGTGGQRDALGGTALVYAGYMLNDTVSVDGQIGFGRYDNELSTVQVGGERIAGSYGSSRLLAGLNVAAVTQVDNWQFYGSGGYSWVREAASSYTASDGNTVAPGNTLIGQLRFSVEAAYQAETMQPYASASYEIDTISSGSGDNTGLVLGLGVRKPVSEGLDFGAALTAQAMRQDEQVYSFTLSARLKF